MFEIKQRSYILGLSLDWGKDSRHFLMIPKDNHGTLKPTDRDTILHPRRECTLGPNPTSEEEMDMKSRTKEMVASLFKNTDVKPPGQTNFTAKKCSQTNKRKRLIRHNIQCRGGKLKTDYTEKWSITESDGILSFIFPEPPLIRCPTLQVILVSSTKHTTKKNMLGFKTWGAYNPCTDRSQSKTFMDYTSQREIDIHHFTNC